MMCRWKSPECYSVTTYKCKSWTKNAQMKNNKKYHIFEPNNSDNKQQQLRASNEFFNETSFTTSVWA